MIRVTRHIKFFARFLKNPIHTGAIAPSSTRLARTMTSWLDLHKANVAVEFGPGDGAVTPFIKQRMKPGAIFFAIELDEKMCKRLKRRYPDVTVYCASATQVGELLMRHGQEKADCIICGLPWAGFRPSLQDELMDATLKALRPGGQFVTFAYLHGMMLPGAHRFRKRLKEAFSHVSCSRVVWRNLPPAFVYQCVL
ncbi:MAG: SAM-dependent methyltransferase, partial [Candidatus Sumerlaeota bacterium]|nr:SAM-dependent methyltransferase [Candidatus Sumerlaeota bacterium]